MSQATGFLSQQNAQLIFHLLKENYEDKMKVYPNFINLFKGKMRQINLTKSGTSNLIEMNKMLLTECTRLLNEQQYDPPPRKETKVVVSDRQAKNLLFKERLDERVKEPSDDQVKEFQGFSKSAPPIKLEFEVKPPDADSFTKSVKDLHSRMMSARSFDMRKVTKDYNAGDAQNWINNEVPPLLKIEHNSMAEIKSEKPPFPIKKVRFQEKADQQISGRPDFSLPDMTHRANRRLNDSRPLTYNPNINSLATPTKDMVRQAATQALESVKLELNAPTAQMPSRAAAAPAAALPPAMLQPKEDMPLQDSAMFLAKLKKTKSREPENLCLRPNEISGNQMKFIHDFGNIKILNINKLFLTNTHTQYQNSLEQNIVVSSSIEPFLVFSVSINGIEVAKNVLFVKKYNDERTIYYEAEKTINITDEVFDITLTLFDKDSVPLPVPSFLTIDSRISGAELQINDQDQRDFAADKYTYLQFKEGTLSAGEKIVINEDEVEIMGTCQIELNIDKYELQDTDYSNHHQHNYCIVEWSNNEINKVQHISRIPIINFTTS